jgi:hypothetical protein
MQTEPPTVRARRLVLAGIKAPWSTPFRPLWALSPFLSLPSTGTSWGSDGSVGCR